MADFTTVSCLHEFSVISEFILHYFIEILTTMSFELIFGLLVVVLLNIAEFKRILNTKPFHSNILNGLKVERVITKHERSTRP